jgi:hypothetical protein
VGSKFATWFQVGRFSLLLYQANVAVPFVGHLYDSWNTRHVSHT